MHFLSSVFALFFLLVVFRLLEPLGVDFELLRGPSHLQKRHFTTEKPHFLIKPDFELKNALEDAFGGLLGSS